VGICKAINHLLHGSRVALPLSVAAFAALLPAVAVLLLLQYKWLEADLKKVNRSVSLSYFRNIHVTNAAKVQ